MLLVDELTEPVRNYRFIPEPTPRQSAVKKSQNDEHKFEARNQHPAIVTICQTYREFHMAPYASRGAGVNNIMYDSDILLACTRFPPRLTLGSILPRRQ